MEAGCLSNEWGKVLFSTLRISFSLGDGISTTLFSLDTFFRGLTLIFLNYQNLIIVYILNFKREGRKGVI